jgi:hypothetical protein
MNNNKNILKIPKTALQVGVLSLIKEEQKKSSGILYIDLSETSFPLSRDFLFVLSKRFHADEIMLIVSEESELKMAKSIWLQGELKGTFAEFEREYEKKNLLAHNMTMWQYFVYELKRGSSYIYFLLFKKFFAKKKERILHFRESSPNMVLMVSGLVVSITLLLFIFHFAVSKTYVSIAPQVTVKPVSSNIIYARVTNTGSELQTARNIITQKVMIIPVIHEMQFTLDTIDPNSTASALWVVTLYNELTTEQALKPQTRLVTESGEVFRTQTWVNVPPSRTVNDITEIGRVEVSVVADPSDEAGKTIGIRGNIKAGTDLSIPGLKFNRDKVYGKAKEDFSGGQDPKVHVVSEPEIKKFEWILREQLLRVARDELQAKLDDNKKTSGEDYALLMGDGIVFTWETLSIASGQKYGDIANEVTLRWTVTVQAIVYDRKATIEYLSAIFREWLLQGTDKEIAIHTDTLRMSNIVSKVEDNSRIKATMEMTASVTYDFENAANELTRHMKLLIAGLWEDTAVERLKEDGHVKDVEITFSPFWISTVSSNIDNIEFVIRQEEK